MNSLKNFPKTFTDRALIKRELSGLLLIDKPKGISTFDIIRKIKKLFYSHGYKRKEIPKIGHAGTLDPFATGLVLVLIGKATKLSQELMRQKKTYEGRLQFGQKTNSGDLEGEFTQTCPLPKKVSSQWGSLQNYFCKNEYWQEPPMFSAKKINGQKLYELARKGIEVPREKKLKKIYSLELINEFYNEEEHCHSIHFKTEVESGTYIRTLAEDLSVQIQTLGHLTDLRRTQSGNHSIEHACSLDALHETNFFEALYATPPKLPPAGNALNIQPTPLSI